MRIDLNRAELDAIWDFAQRKQAYKDKLNVRSRRRSDSDEITTQVKGTVGEVALAKLLDIEPDFNIYAKGDKYDALWRGHRIEVKTTTVSGLRIYEYNAEKTCLHSDLLVAMKVNKRLVENRNTRTLPIEFVGYLPTSLFFYRIFTDGKRVERPNYTTYILPEHALFNPKLMLNLESRC